MGYDVDAEIGLAGRWKNTAVGLHYNNNNLRSKMNYHQPSVMSAITEQQSLDTEGSGLSLILSKYKSVSLIEAFPNSFQEISKSEFIRNYRSALYCGNVSDLWQYFKFNLKYEFKKLHPADRRILRILLNFVQNYFLVKAIERVPQSSQKERMREKAKHFLTTYLEKEQQRQNIIMLLKDRMKENSSYFEFLKTLKHLNFSADNIQHIVKSLFLDQGGELALILYESAIDFILMKRKESSIIQKPNQEELKRTVFMKLLGLHLKFTLRNQHWKTIALSKSINSHMQIYNLCQPNGATSLVYFYQDAPLKTLQNQFTNFSSVFLQ